MSGCGSRNSSEKISNNVLSPTPPFFYLQTTVGTIPTDAAWVAGKNGDDEWKYLQSYSAGKYSFPVSNSDGKYSIAIASQSNSGNFIQVYNSTLNELPRLRHALPGATAPVKYKLSISTTGVASPENYLSVNVGNSGYLYTVTSPNQIFNTTFDLTSGKYDIVAIPTTAGEIPGRMFIARNVDLTADSNINIVLGSDNQTFLFPSDFTVQMYNMPQESADSSRIGYMGYKTKNGTWISFSKKSAIDPFQFSYPKMPESYIWPGDMYQVNMVYADANTTRQTQLYFGYASHKSVYLAPDMNNSEYTPTTAGSYFVPEVTLPAYPDVRFYSVKLSGNLSGSSTMISWDVLSTTNWLNNKGSVVFPDLSKIEGWKNEWAITKESDITQFNLYTTACNRPLIQYAAIFSANFTQLGDTEITACMKKISKSNRKVNQKEINIIKEIRTDLL